MYDLSDPCEPITGLLLEPFPDKQNKFYVLATTPRRYMQLTLYYMYIDTESIEHCYVYMYTCSSLQCVIVSLSLVVGFTNSSVRLVAAMDPSLANSLLSMTTLKVTVL